MNRPLALALLAAAAAASAPLAAQEYRTAEAKISNALSAAPSAISASATIMDWPSGEGGSFVVLRPGTNGWTCLPHMPGAEGNAPMCLDQAWMDFMHAVMTRGTPKIDRVGIGYMVAPGGAYASNTDPYATGPTPTNEWGYDPPHLMVLVPHAATALKGLPTKRDGGGPWVMFSGTKYAHIMVPLEDPKR